MLAHVCIYECMLGCVCVYVCMCVSVSLSIYIYLFIYMYVYTHLFIYVCACMCVGMCKCVWPSLHLDECVSVCVCVGVCDCVWMCIYVCVFSWSYNSSHSIWSSPSELSPNKISSTFSSGMLFFCWAIFLILFERKMNQV